MAFLPSDVRGLAESLNVFIAVFKCLCYSKLRQLLIELDVEGKTRMAVLKDIQFHPVKDTILHIDLLEVKEDKPVVIEVPVKLEGHAQFKTVEVDVAYLHGLAKAEAVDIDNKTLGNGGIGSAHLTVLNW